MAPRLHSQRKHQKNLSWAGTVSKPYNGMTDCDGAGLSLKVEKRFSEDDVTATAASCEHDSADAGKNKAITAEGITLSGVTAGTPPWTGLERSPRQTFSSQSPPRTHRLTTERQALTGAFADVDNSQWYAEGVAWAEAQGIIGGYGNRRFGSNNNITREQLTVMLWHYAGSPAATVRELHFADAHQASDWALEALRWTIEKGIINGKDGGILAPNRAGRPRGNSADVEKLYEKR